MYLDTAQLYSMYAQFPEYVFSNPISIQVNSLIHSSVSVGVGLERAWLHLVLIQPEGDRQVSSGWRKCWLRASSRAFVLPPILSAPTARVSVLSSHYSNIYQAAADFHVGAPTARYLRPRCPSTLAISSQNTTFNQRSGFHCHRGLHG